MKEFSQSGADKPLSATGTFDCAAVESWLAEAAEENLPSGIAAQVQQHAQGCAGCREKLAQARRGRDWLQVLKQEALEPPAGLPAKIVARTSGAEALPVVPAVRAALPPVDLGRFFEHKEKADAADGLEPKAKETACGQAETYVPPEYASGAAASSAIPAWKRTSLVALRHKIMDPRLALVAAMAFFSISLTLNLVGIHLSKVRAVDLQPQNLRRAVTRQYAEANAHVVRYYENLRIVYEVESRVQQLRRAAETAPAPPPSDAKPSKGSSDTSRDPGGRQGPRRDGMAGNPKRPAERNAVPPEPAPVTAGPKMDVAFPASRLFEMLGNFNVVVLGGAKGTRVVRKTAGPSTCRRGDPTATSGRDDKFIYETTSIRSTRKERGLA